MNKHKIFAAVLGASILFAACKKNDLQSEALKQATSESKTASNWSSQKMEKYTEFSSSIADSSITSAVASKGLVLAFKRSSNSMEALPFTETVGTSIYSWYYQVAEGSITFSADAYGLAKEPSSSTGFNYFIVSEQKIKDLESKGYTKAKLMTLSYNDASTLLK